MARRKLSAPLGKNATQKKVSAPIPGQIYIIWPKKEIFNVQDWFFYQFNQNGVALKDLDLIAVPQGSLVTFLHQEGGIYRFLFNEYTIGCYMEDMEFYQPNWY